MSIKDVIALKNGFEVRGVQNWHCVIGWERTEECESFISRRQRTEDQGLINFADDI